MAQNLQIETAEGVSILTFDLVESRWNTLSIGLLGEFEQALDRLESSSGLRGVILRSGKSDQFIVGADLDEIHRLVEVEQTVDLVRRAQSVVRRWIRLPMPTVAVLRGPALGGGLELAMACTRRVASAEPQTVLGMPEVLLGLIPALGGTYRLPALVGLETGLKMLLTGRRVSAGRALEIGLVDALAAPEGLLDAANSQLARGPAGAAGAATGERGLARRIRRRAVLAVARKRIAASAEHYPAPAAILEVVEKGLKGGLDWALELESRRFGELAASPQSHQLIRLFQVTRELSGAQPGVPLPGEEGERDGVGVVGAGFMGAGIAAAAVLAGFRVAVTDAEAGALERAHVFLRGRIESRLDRGHLDAASAERAIQRFTLGAGVADLAEAKWVVEAVPEDLGLKREILARIESAVGPDALIASNTSTLPISDLATCLRRPERFLGLHFFSPVHRMQLVEIVRHPGNDEEIVRRATEFIRRLGKTPIVVRDGPGFFTTRILSAYLAQGTAMLQERIPVAEIDRSGRAAGFPVGPLELLDEVGIDVAAKVSAVLRGAFPRRAVGPETLDLMVQAGRLGRKSGRGFYKYRDDGKRPDERVHRDVFGWPGVGAEVGPELLGERLLFAMAVEAVRCLEEGIVGRPEDGDVGAVLGLGFPPFRGGPFRFLDDLGAELACRRLDQLEDGYGAAFDCPDSLRHQAETRGRFYPQEI